ncbi:hypothetical protein VULLAG_LOCUS521 [Vulpes lagopus]
MNLSQGKVFQRRITSQV